MKIIKIFLLLLFFFPCLLRAEEAVINTPADAVKGALPMCTDDFSLYDKLGGSGIGETLMWLGAENSPLATEQGGVVMGFFLNKKNGNWSVLFTGVKSKKTCFFLTGKNWKEISPETPWKITIGGSEKGTGYCTSIEQISKELLKTGNGKIGFGSVDSNFIEVDAGINSSKAKPAKRKLVNITVHIFSDSFGMRTLVTDTTYTDATKTAKIACVDAKISVKSKKSSEE